MEYYAANQAKIPASLSQAPASTDAGEIAEEDRAIRRAITYVSGMTDRFAFGTAVRLLGWRLDRLPRGIDAPAISL